MQYKGVGPSLAKMWREEGFAGESRGEGGAGEGRELTGPSQGT